jgi:DNA-binding transcriptional LysR family regulator
MLQDLEAFIAVASAGGFRDASRATGDSASRLSEAVRRVEARLGVRLLNRTTRSVSLTEAGARLLTRIGPSLGEIDSALDSVKSLGSRPAGTLRLNVPVSAARMVLPKIVPPFLAAHPDIRLEVVAEEQLVDILAAGCDAGIRYEERLEKDMIAVPIGPRRQRFAVAASHAYLERRGRPRHPRDLLAHTCLRGRFNGRAIPSWEFERDGEVVNIDPSGPLVVSFGGASDLLVDVAVAGTGIVYTFEDWVRPHLRTGALKPLLERWWLEFPGPFLYYPSRRQLPAPLRAFVDFISLRAIDTR